MTCAMGRIQIQIEMTGRMTTPPVRPIAPNTPGFAMSCRGGGSSRRDPATATAPPYRRSQHANGQQAVLAVRSNGKIVDHRLDVRRGTPALSPASRAAPPERRDQLRG